MPELREVLSSSRTLCGAQGFSKKRLFETVAGLISSDQPGLSADDIYAALLAREKLGSTALGEGIAIPHCRLQGCEQAVGALITLAEPIEFDAPDGRGVDLLFVLLVPEEGHQEHLNLLSSLAGLLSREDFCKALRGAPDGNALYRAAVDFEE
jgi:PTS system nitrogen regulatory IIA component